jgi:hypothetical protein
MTDVADIDERTARALELTGLDCKAVADRLVQIGELRPPTREETRELLVEVLRSALRQSVERRRPVVGRIS